VPERAGLSRCRAEFKKINLINPVAQVSVIVSTTRAGVAIETVEVDFRIGSTEKGELKPVPPWWRGPTAHRHRWASHQQAVSRHRV